MEVMRQMLHIRIATAHIVLLCCDWVAVLDTSNDKLLTPVSALSTV